jgi:hypothetical protein
MSEQLISELEDGLHAAAHRASAAGLNLQTIADVLASATRFATYMAERNPTKPYPPCVSAETAKRRAMSE